MRFSPAFTERLRNHFLLSEVIGRRLPIKKHGREFHALCPFHQEKSPSFTINDEKGFFHCFGCGAHGDAIEFIKRFERLTYPETIERLAREAGIALPVATPEERKKADSEKTLHQVMEAACQWFERQLMSPAGMSALSYAQGRGLKPETMRQFRIGYAPEGRTGLMTHLTQLGFTPALMKEAGLIIETDSGSCYDRFRGRLMFAIRAASGKVVAFGGRLLATDSAKNQPKYLNSPETPLFKKGEMLFNFDQARSPAREAGLAVVMEGYMDVVSVAQSGVAYALATLGTAVTPEHLRLLWQLCKEPVLCLDGDAAGERAMQRAVEVALPLLKPGYSLRFATLPRGEDPDSYVQRHGKASFEQLLRSAKRLSEQLWQTLSAQHALTTPDGLAALKDSYRKLLEKMADATVRSEYLRHFDRMHYQLHQNLWKQAKQKPKSAGRAASPQVAQMVAQHHSSALDALVRRMLQTLMQFPQLLQKSQVEEVVCHLDIRTASLDALRNAMLCVPHEAMENAADFAAALRAQLPDALSHLGAASFQLPPSLALDAQNALMLWNETASAYQVAHLEFELAALQEEMARTMDEKDYLRLVEIKQAIEKAKQTRNFAPAWHVNAAD